MPALVNSSGKVLDFVSFGCFIVLRFGFIVKCCFIRCTSLFDAFELLFGFHDSSAFFISDSLNPD